MYKNTNTVFYGDHAKELIAFLGTRPGSHVFPTPDTIVYRAAPRGYPRTPQEVKNLVSVVHDESLGITDRAGAFLLIDTFFQTAIRIDLLDQ